MTAAMAMSWNEIRENAIRFVAEWRGETQENAEAQSFWNDWFAMLGIVRRRYVQYEHRPPDSPPADVAGSTLLGGSSRCGAQVGGQVSR